jgi:hypothetical protein
MRTGGLRIGRIRTCKDVDRQAAEAHHPGKAGHEYRTFKPFRFLSTRLEVLAFPSIDEMKEMQPATSSGAKR